jgi:hypothetical protein
MGLIPKSEFLNLQLGWGSGRQALSLAGFMGESIPCSYASVSLTV